MYVDLYGLLASFDMFGCLWNLATKHGDRREYGFDMWEVLYNLQSPVGLYPYWWKVTSAHFHQESEIAIGIPHYEMEEDKPCTICYHRSILIPLW